MIPTQEQVAELLLDAASRFFSGKSFSRDELVSLTARTGRAQGWWLTDRHVDSAPTAVGQAFNVLTKAGVLIKDDRGRWLLGRPHKSVL
jgi:hypothetical protein